MKETLRYALINSFGTALYVAMIASLMSSMEGGFFPEKTILAPIAMLMLFVFSAAFTGFLVFGKPIMWYIDGKKKDAIALLSYTMAIFLAIIVLVWVVLLSV